MPLKVSLGLLEASQIFQNIQGLVPSTVLFSSYQRWMEDSQGRNISTNPEDEAVRLELLITLPHFHVFRCLTEKGMPQHKPSDPRLVKHKQEVVKHIRDRE